MLTPWKECYDQPRQHIQKQRHYIANKVHLVKAMVFPVVMFGCENWTVKKAEHWRTDAFELWCWRRLLRVHWTERRSNQSILKEISSGCSLEGLTLKLKLQYLGHLMRRADSLEKTLMLGGIGGRRRRGWQRMRWLDGITDWWTWVWVNSGSWWWIGRPGMLWFMGSQSVGHDWATELNWLKEMSSESFYSAILATLPKYIFLMSSRHGMWLEWIMRPVKIFTILQSPQPSALRFAEHWMEKRSFWELVHSKRTCRQIFSILLIIIFFLISTLFLAWPCKYI